MNEKTTRVIRWTARIWASLMAAMIAVIFVGHAVEGCRRWDRAIL